MPDSMYVDVEIGGEISSKSIPEMYRILDENFSDTLDMPTSIEELNEYSGMDLIFSGECNDYTKLRDFCQSNKLTCIIKISPDTSWNRGICYTHNGSDSIAFDRDDNNEDLLHPQSKVKPLFQLLLDYAEHGIVAFPLHTENEQQTVAELAKDGLGNTKNFINLFRDKVNELFPEIPEVPPFIIKEE